MQTINDNNDPGSNYQAWAFLAKFSLSDFLSDEGKGDALTAGLLFFQTVCQLGIPPEYVENIKMTLAGFAKTALMHSKQGRLLVSGRIRIFCQKKILEDLNSTRAASRPYRTKHAIEHTQMVLDTSTKMEGGWSYFLVERGGNIFNGSIEGNNRSVDLYLYKESE